MKILITLLLLIPQICFAEITSINVYNSKSNDLMYSKTSSISGYSADDFRDELLKDNGVDIRDHKYKIVMKKEDTQADIDEKKAKKQRQESFDSSDNQKWKKILELMAKEYILKNNIDPKDL